MKKTSGVGAQKSEGRCGQRESLRGGQGPVTLWNKAGQGCEDWDRGDSIWLEQSLSETSLHKLHFYHTCKQVAFFSQLSPTKKHFLKSL